MLPENYSSLQPQQEIIELNLLAAKSLLKNKEDCLLHARKALLLSRTINYRKGMADAYLNIGAFHLKGGEPLESLKNYKKSLLIYDLLADKKGIGEGYNRIGKVYYHLTNYDKAIDFSLKALEIRESSQDLAGIADTANNIGAIYHKLHNLKKTMEYYDKSLENYEEIADLGNSALILNNIGEVYIEMKKFKEAAVYFGRSFQFSHRNFDRMGLGISLKNIGKIYLNQKKYLFAIKTFKRSLQIMEELDEHYLVAKIRNNLGFTFLKMAEYKEAYHHISSSLELARNLRAKDILILNYQNLSELFAAENDFAQAFSYLKSYCELNESIFNEEIRRRVAELTTRYEIDKKEKETEIYRLKNIELVEVNHNLQEANKVIVCKNRELQEAYSQLELLARTDPLTGLSNRRGILEKIDSEMIRYERHRSSFAVIICDIDDFKKFNDRFGHECGDHVLVSIGEHLSSILRRQDEVARWGGEEFLLMLPETDLKSGRKVAELIRNKILLNPLTYREDRFVITMTFGVSIFVGESSINECIRRADRALYRGKVNGKNCVVEG